MMTGSRKNLLYTFNHHNKGFGFALVSETSRPNYGTEFRTRIVFPYDGLIEGANGFVFLGPQTSENKPETAVFRDYPTFFNFMEDLKGRGRKLLSLMEAGMRLPKGSERWVDKTVIYTRFDSVRSVSEKTLDYFVRALQD
jgi:hypothetical protein